MQSFLILAAMAFAAPLTCAQTLINWAQIQNSPSTDNTRPLGDATHRFTNIYGVNFFGAGTNLTGVTATGITGKTFLGTASQITQFLGTPVGQRCIHTDLNFNLTEAAFDCGSGGGGGGFNSITTGTNTTAIMTVGTGASLTFTGTGIVNASQLNGGAFTGANGNLVSFGAASIPADSGILANTVIRSNQANTWTGPGLQSMSAVDLLMPVHTADPATCTAGQIQYNSTGAVAKLCLTTNTWTSIVTGTVGTGNAGTNVTTTFSATPTFTCPSSTGGTVVNFILSTALTASITSSTLQTCTNGAILNFAFTQDPTGNRTVAMPTGFDPLTVHSAPNIVTKAQYFLDSGGGGHLLSVISGAGYGFGSEVAAPGTPPPAGCFSWFDSTNHVPSWKCNGSATVSSSVVPVTRTANQFLTSLSAAGVLGFSAIATADLPATTTQTIVPSTTTAMPIIAVPANNCSTTATTVTATGALTTDSLIVNYSGDPTGLTGYGGGTAGGITIRPWLSAGNANFKLCNETANSITPGALSVIWRVVR